MLDPQRYSPSPKRSERNGQRGVQIKDNVDREDLHLVRVPNPDDTLYCANLWRSWNNTTTQQDRRVHPVYRFFETTNQGGGNVEWRKRNRRKAHLGQKQIGWIGRFLRTRS